MSREQSSLNDPFSWINKTVVPKSDHTHGSKRRNGKSLNDLVDKKDKKTHSEIAPVSEPPQDLNYLFHEEKPREITDRDIDILNYIDPKQDDEEEETEPMDLNYLFIKNELKYTHYQYKDNENPIDNLMNEYGQWIECAVKEQVGKIKKKLMQQPRIGFIQPPSRRPPPPPNALS